MPTVSDYDARRGSARARGYDARWDRSAKVFRAHHPLCLGCEAEGRISVATVVDHVLPHRGDMDLFWDATKWQPACDFHHNVVKQQLEHLFDRGAIAEADLWLNSARAIAISRRERSATGADGWPTDR
ncbi:MAG: HNH endonuclease [Rhizobiales bacterium]|nr:HNH endonuclease [Hyphomicrobiales bacterium]